MQHPVGFADIVAKVKPAVISVRIKVSAEPALLQHNRTMTTTNPSSPGSPLDKFFQQFGDQFGRQFGPHAPRGMTPSPAKAPASSSRRTAMQ